MASPQGREARAARIVSAFRWFFGLQAAGSLVLLGATVAALVWANSPFAGGYESLWGRYLQVGAGPLAIRKPLLLWVNDGLMAVFFLLVGLEMKREVVQGQLSARRAAALPVFAALGGVVLPALIYFSLNRSGPAAAGWAVPMATDIAFALGFLALLGSRVPSGLRLLLAAAAIVDDLVAVLVIAVFYTPSVSLVALGLALALLGVLFLLGRRGVEAWWPYALLGTLLWVAVLKSGVHATVAGVALAMTIPLRARREPEEPLLLRMEHALVPVVAFFVMPVFALANAGVALDVGAEALLHPVTAGVALGLAVGKPVGVTALCLLAVRAGWASLPPGVGWRHVHGASWLCGIGFTMALFIASLGLPPELEARAKLGILVASAFAALVGVAILGLGPASTRARSARS